MIFFVEKKSLTQKIFELLEKVFTNKTLNNAIPNGLFIENILKVPNESGLISSTSASLPPISLVRTQMIVVFAFR